MLSLLCASFVAMVAAKSHNANGRGGVPLPRQPHPDGVQTHPHAPNGSPSVDATHPRSTKTERRMKRRTAPLPKQAEPATVLRQEHVGSDQMQAVHKASKNHVPRAKLNITDTSSTATAPKVDGSRQLFPHARNSTEPTKPAKVPKKGASVVREALNEKKAPKSKLAKHANKDLP